MNFQLYINEEKRGSKEEGIEIGRQQGLEESNRKHNAELTRIMEQLRETGMPEVKIRSILFPKNETSQANA